jgi:hypothetical protein
VLKVVRELEDFGSCALTQPVSLADHLVHAHR